MRARVESAVSRARRRVVGRRVGEISRPPTAEETAARAIARDPRLIPEVKRVIAVASGKGGVGKSTVAANLAVALGRLGYATGLLDADIYGPSQPMMLGYQGARPRPTPAGNKLLPFSVYGIKTMSLGSILDADTPVIWRGPMVMKAIEQLLSDVEWGALDFLVIDLPPGTGDAQLTLTQKVPLSGAVIVTTPQDVALIDARKGLAMFTKVNVPVLGIIENMSTFVCPHCGTETAHLPARRRPSAPRPSWAARSWARSRSTPRSPRAATPACRSWSPSPTVRHAAAFRAVAEEVARDAWRGPTSERPRAGHPLSVVPVALLADAHVGGPGGHGDDLARELDGLDRSRCELLLLLGDLFHVWVGDRRYETDEIARLLAVLDRRARTGRRSCATSKATATSSSRTACTRATSIRSRESMHSPPAACAISRCTATASTIATGATASGGALSKNPVSRAAARRLPGALARRFVHGMDRRLAETNFEHKIRIPEAVIRRFGEQRLAEGHDVVLLGHFHQPMRFAVRGGEVRIVDAWFNRRRLEWLP